MSIPSARQLDKRLSALVVALLLLAIGWLSQPPTVTPANTPVNSPPVEIAQASSTPATVTSTNAVVVRAVDGDTLDVKLDGATKEVKVRLLGVNTPETVDPRKTVECFGKEASAYTHAKVDGQRVRLDADPQADEVDKYGRLLRNVVLADGTDFNATLVREGYAYAYLSYPLNKQRKAQIKQLETEAKAASRGLWAPTACAK